MNVRFCHFEKLQYKEHVLSEKVVSCIFMRFASLLQNLECGRHFIIIGFLVFSVKKKLLWLKVIINICKYISK